MTELGLLVTGAIAGAMAFFTLVVAPAAFRVLPQQQAGTLVRSVFPIYYLTLALAAAAAAMLLGFESPTAGRILAVAAAVSMASRVWLLPRMERLRKARESGDEGASRQFRRLHAFSMALNLVVFAAVAVAFFIAS